MFANRISSSTSCSICLPETSPPSSSQGVLRHRFQSCNTSGLTRPALSLGNEKMAFDIMQIETIVIVMMENRSFDHMPVGNAAITNSAKPAAVDRHRRAADVRAAVDGGRLAGDAGGDDFRFQVCPAPNRPASKDDNVARTASSPGTYGAESQDSRLFAAFGVFSRHTRRRIIRAPQFPRSRFMPKAAKKQQAPSGPFGDMFPYRETLET